MISPARIRGGPSAARVRAVDYIVMNQRGAVQKLDDGGETDSAAFGTLARVTRGKKQKRGPQALSSSAQKIAGDLRNRLEGGGGLSREFLLDRGEVVADEIENFPGRQKWDGFPPGLLQISLEPEAVNSPAPSVPDADGFARRKKRRKFAAVAAAASSGGKFLTLASVRATSTT